MPTYKGSAKVRTIYHGDTKIARIFKGDIKVFGDYKTITKTVTTNGTVVVPANVFRVDLLVIGGGGGGATSTFYHGNKWQGRAGASGAVCQSIFTGQAAKDLRGKTLTYTVGAGGVAGGWQESYDGTIHAGVTGCVSWVFYVSE